MLIHAVQVAIAPVLASFSARWPEADPVNLLDDALSLDRALAPDLSPNVTERIVALADYAVTAGARGVLYTCSAFGPAIERAALAYPKVPVLKPNEAMFEEALTNSRAEGRTLRVGLLATFPPSLPTMQVEFSDEARRLGVEATLVAHVVPRALEALKAGDAATHDGLLHQAAPRLADCDAVCLAHFSTARARDSVAPVVPCPVLTSPDSAVEKLRRLVRDD